MRPPHSQILVRIAIGRQTNQSGEAIPFSFLFFLAGPAVTCLNKQRI